MREDSAPSSKAGSKAHPKEELNSIRRELKPETSLPQFSLKASEILPQSSRDWVRAFVLTEILDRPRFRRNIFGSLFACLFFANTFFSAGFSEPNAAETPTAPPPFSEEQIQRNIARVAYTSDSEVIKLGLKYLEKIQSKMDLSERSDLLDALVRVLTTSTTDVPTLSSEAKEGVARVMGITKLTPKAEPTMIELLASPNSKYAEIAAVEYARTARKIPGVGIIRALKDLEKNDVLREIALVSADSETIEYLILVAERSQRFEPLYGLDSLRAANIAVKNYLDFFNLPAAPTNLVATLTTYNSIQLSWTDNSSNEQEFEIDCATDDGPMKELIRVPGNTLYYSHRDLLPEKTYRYRVRAMNLVRDGSSSEQVSVTTPSPPVPMPEPAPSIPDLPVSPPTAMNLADLTKRLKVYIENKPHAETLTALIQYLKLATSSAAVEASRVLVDQFDRKAFDFSPETTSIGIKAITEMNLRATNEFNNYLLPEALRKEYGNTLRRHATTLQERFLKDDTPK